MYLGVTLWVTSEMMKKGIRCSAREFEDKGCVLNVDFPYPSGYISIYFKSRTDMRKFVDALAFAVVNPHVDEASESSEE